MPHAIVYYGHYEHSFHRLHPAQDRYWNKAHPDGEGLVVERPEQPTQLEFGVLQTKEDGHVVAKVGPYVLPTPVPYISDRHGGKGIGVKPTLIENDPAASILLDVLVLNPELRVDLVPLLRAMGR